MNSDFFKYGLLLLLLPFLQVSIFNNIDFMGYINPYLYVIFVFVFPLKKDKTSLLISSFLLGLFVDFLTNDGGIHAFSLVFVAYIRLFVLQLITQKSDSDIENLNIRNISYLNLLVWISILTFIHHFILFSLEQFSFKQFNSLLLKTFLTSIFSIVLIIFGLQLFMKKRSNA